MLREWITRLLIPGMLFDGIGNLPTAAPTQFGGDLKNNVNVQSQPAIADRLGGADYPGGLEPRDVFRQGAPPLFCIQRACPQGWNPGRMLAPFIPRVSSLHL
jgi:hypothetical protein